MFRRLSAIAAGLLAATAILVAAASSNDAEIRSRRREIERETRVVVRLFATRIQGGLQRHLTALQQMANFYASSRKVSEKEFRSFAATTLRMNPSCLNVALVDPFYEVQRVHPPGDRRLVVGLDIRAHPIGFETILRARKARGPVVSPPLQLIPGAPGFELAVPIFAGGEYRGALVGACRSDDYFASLLLPEMSERYEHRVLDSDIPVFTSAGFDFSDRTTPVISELFTEGDALWKVEVRPHTDLLRERLESGRAAFWTMAWLLALTSGSLVCAGVHWAAGVKASLRTHRAALLETTSRLAGTREQLMQAEKLTALGELVASVAHEINNPLAGVVGYTQLLLGEKVSARIRRRLTTIGAEAERMTRIVRNLLTFARKHSSEKALVDLNVVIQKTLELRAYQLRVNQIKVVRDLAPGLPKTMLDFHQIQQVLINLLSNAQHAIGETGRAGTIRLTTRHAAPGLELRVADDGPGIPAEHVSRIFDPFFTTKEEGQGTGLGLSLCYGIIQEHGGSIRAEGRPGEGTTFIIMLPIVEAAETAEPSPPVQAGPAIPALRILVVDDEPSVQSFLSELLRGRGHRVDTASDAPEAIEKIYAGEHDIIITDLKMPHGSGRDVHRAAAAKDPALGRRVVFISGNPSSEDTQRFFREAGGPFVPKPFTIEDIDRAIAFALGA